LFFPLPSGGKSQYINVIFCPPNWINRLKHTLFFFLTGFSRLFPVPKRSSFFSRPTHLGTTAQFCIPFPDFFLSTFLTLNVPQFFSSSSLALRPLQTGAPCVALKPIQTFFLPWNPLQLSAPWGSSLQSFPPRGCPLLLQQASPQSDRCVFLTRSQMAEPPSFSGSNFPGCTFCEHSEKEFHTTAFPSTLGFFGIPVPFFKSSPCKSQSPSPQIQHPLSGLFLLNPLFFMGLLRFSFWAPRVRTSLLCRVSHLPRKTFRVILYISPFFFSRRLVTGPPSCRH